MRSLQGRPGRRISGNAIQKGSRIHGREAARVRTTLLLPAILLTACGMTPSLYVESELKPYVDWVLEEAHARGVNLGINNYDTSIRFIQEFEEPEVVGQCQWRGSVRRIYVLKSYFDSASELERGALMFHEVGHCFLDYGHYEEKFEDYCAVSLMNSYLPPQHCLETYWNHYLDEFFEVDFVRGV